MKARFNLGVYDKIKPILHILPVGTSSTFTTRTHEIFTTTNTFCQSQREMKKSGEDNWFSLSESGVQSIF